MRTDTRPPTRENPPDHLIGEIWTHTAMKPGEYEGGVWTEGRRQGARRELS